eukprot:357233-Chlamydomonas_euryale.AAC.11
MERARRCHAVLWPCACEHAIVLVLCTRRGTCTVPCYGRHYQCHAMTDRNHDGAATMMESGL